MVWAAAALPPCSPWWREPERRSSPTPATPFPYQRTHLKDSREYRAANVHPHTHNQGWLGAVWYRQKHHLFFFCNFQHRVTVFGLFSRNCRDVVSFSYTGGFYSNVPYSLLWLSPNTLCQILHCWLNSILKCNCLRQRNTMQGGTILKMSVRLTSVNHLTLGWMRAWVRADSLTRRPFYTCVPLY